MDFTSTIITQDEYTVSKLPFGQKETDSDFKIKPLEMNHHNVENLNSSSHNMGINFERKLEQPTRVNDIVISNDDHKIQELTSSFKSSINLSMSDVEKELNPKDITISSEKTPKSSVKIIGKSSVENHDSLSERRCEVEQSKSQEKLAQEDGEKGEVATCVNTSTFNLNAEEKLVKKEPRLSKGKLKSALKTSGEKKLSRSVTWADKKMDSSGSKNLCEFEEVRVVEESSVGGTHVDDEDIFRYASAEACATALNQASEAVTSGESDVTEAGNVCYL